MKKMRMKGKGREGQVVVVRQVGELLPNGTSAFTLTCYIDRAGR